MKTVYVMWNYDGGEVMFASEDKELVQEMMYDFFIEDAMGAYGWEYHERDFKFPAPISKIMEEVLGWYRDYVTILEIPVVN
jgi:hypothetical protein